MKRMTREWIRKAEDDFQTAELIEAGGQPLHDQVCFHCQQSAEKYLKARLHELGVVFPKTHDLEYLLNLLLPHHGSLGRHRRAMRFLSRFAVDPRYPLMHTTKRQAASALRYARELRHNCRNLLGLDPPARRRKRS